MFSERSLSPSSCSSRSELEEEVVGSGERLPVGAAKQETVISSLLLLLCEKTSFFFCPPPLFLLISSETVFGPSLSPLCVSVARPCAGTGVRFCPLWSSRWRAKLRRSAWQTRRQTDPKNVLDTSVVLSCAQPFRDTICYIWK